MKAYLLKSIRKNFNIKKIENYHIAVHKKDHSVNCEDSDFEYFIKYVLDNCGHDGWGIFHHSRRNKKERREYELEKTNKGKDLIKMILKNENPT